ncbi:MAG: biotin--[acetyl-CoA-carboxylase] ligase [Azonexus sp.]|jgi:BirA family biotin operon repressor/biotin-[acetyl-CoA-carboxylase] ligase|nr:biotin--[acetyl-CoA-carboxylase] ligase [Azonexus sp.]
MALIDPVLLKARLGSLSGRFDVDALDECDSTSSELMRRTDRGAPAGTVVVADRQSAGRGRRGRTWLSSPESSLTFSLLWRFPGPVSRLSGLSLAVGLGLAQALEGLGVRGIRLKWPNDVLLESEGEFAKLAGVLIELTSDRRGSQAIIGIGLNLDAPSGDFPMPVTGLTRASSLPPDRHAVLAAILARLAVVLDKFAVDGFSCLKSEWQCYHAWQDQMVQILADGAEPQHGRCMGVDDDGALLLDTGAGIERIHSGDVSLRPAVNSLGGARP